MVTKSAQAEQAEAMKKKPAAPDWLAALKSIQDGPMTTPLWPMTIKTGRHLPGEIDMVDPYPVVETCVDYNPPLIDPLDLGRVKFSGPIQEAAFALRMKGFVIIEDDPDREGEGDLCLAAENATPYAINFMMREACGLVCVALTPERCEQLMLPPLRVKRSDDSPNFVMPCDLLTHGSGISASERAETIRALADPTMTAGANFRTPGHVFPLATHPEGLSARRGHTEAGVELCKVAGLQPAAVLCELLDTEGEPRTTDQIKVYAKIHDIPVVTVEQIVQYGKEHS
jgi:3,4-dihydroxy-2-butanone 4-phosphate synthase